ncbi:hypothetical protein AAMO2058_000678000 [Amorphochlora amoebiformis]
MSSGYRLGGANVRSSRVVSRGNPCDKVGSFLWTLLDAVKIFGETLINPDAHKAYATGQCQNGRANSQPRGRQYGGGRRLGGNIHGLGGRGKKFDGYLDRSLDWKT